MGRHGSNETEQVPDQRQLGWPWWKISNWPPSSAFESKDTEEDEEQRKKKRKGWDLDLHINLVQYFNPLPLLNYIVCTTTGYKIK